MRSSNLEAAFQSFIIESVSEIYSWPFQFCKRPVHKYMCFWKGLSFTAHGH